MSAKLLTIIMFSLGVSNYSLFATDDPFVPMQGGKPTLMPSGDNQTLGKPIESDSRRSAVRLSDVQAMSYFPDFNPQSEIVLANFHHLKSWYVVKIPIGKVTSLHYIDDVLEASTRTRHGALRFEFSEKVVAKPQNRSDPNVQLYTSESIVFNVLATGVKGYSFNQESSDAGNLMSAFQFNSVEDTVRRARISTKLRGPLRSPIHKYEMWEMHLSKVTPHQSRLILEESIRQATSHFQAGGYGRYRLRCENCVNIIHNICEDAVEQFKSLAGQRCEGIKDVIKSHGITATTVFKMRGMVPWSSLPVNIIHVPALKAFL